MKRKGKTTLYLNSFDFWNLFKKSFISGKIIENLWEEENTLCKELKKGKINKIIWIKYDKDYWLKEVIACLNLILNCLMFR